jgi:large subunit ribosomal protein L17
MRHGNGYSKLGRDTAHRISMLNNLSKSLIDNDRIQTTLGRAKELKRYAERIITLGKKDSIHSRRLAFARLQNRDLVKKLFNEIAPKYSKRAGGYTRIIKSSTRRGDGAKIAIIELV